MDLLARIQEFLRAPSFTGLANDARVMDVARTLVSYYYYVLPFLAFLHFMSIETSRPNFDPLWPLWFFTTSFSPEYFAVANIVRFLFIGASLVGVFFYQNRACRFLVFLAVWQAHALESSFGQPNHQWYMWLFSSLIFVFLPNIWKDRESSEKNRAFLLVVWWAQAQVMLLYTMAGIQKFMTVYLQYTRGEVHGFSVEGFAYQIAAWLPRLQEDAPLGPFIIMHPEWGWPFYIALHFVQLFAFWAMIRTSLQRVWAVFLVMFHMGTYITMGISFNPLMLLLVLLFFNSPFVPARFSWRQFLFDLPVVGQIAEWIMGRKKRVVA